MPARSLAVVLAAAACLAAGPAAAPADPVVDKLQSRWEFQRGAVTSGRFRAVLFRHSGSKAKLTAADVERFAAKLDTPVGSAAELFDRLPEAEWGGGSAGCRLDVVADRGKVRNDWGCRDGRGETLSFDRIAEVQTMPQFNQASLFTGRSSLEALDIRTLCYVPGRVEFLAEGFAVTAGAPNRVTAGDRFKRFTADADTGFVRRFVSGEKGSPGLEVLQSQPVAYPGGVVMPVVTAEVRYEGKAASMWNVYYIERAEPSAKIDPAEFRVAAPAGTNVIDARAGWDDRRTFKPATDLADVLEAAGPVRGKD